RDARDRQLVGRLEDVYEVVLAECRPLGGDGCAELLDLLVDLADPPRVVLQRLDALGGQGGEKDVGRHQASGGRVRLSFSQLCPRYASRPRATAPIVVATAFATATGG